MAIQRYLAICQPMKARQRINVTFSRWSVVAVFGLSIVINLPRFWCHQIIQYCFNDETVYYVHIGPLKENRILEIIYLCIHFTLAIIIPVMLLAYCNVNLVKALRRSTHLRRNCSSFSKTQKCTTEPTHRITLTLVIIIVMYMLLVTPAEVLNFTYNYCNCTYFQYNLLGSFANIAQACNISFNFILYCIVNMSFRRTLRSMILCPIQTIRSVCRTKRGNQTMRLNMSASSLRETAISERTDLL